MRKICVIDRTVCCVSPAPLLPVFGAVLQQANLCRRYFPMLSWCRVFFANVPPLQQKHFVRWNKDRSEIFINMNEIDAYERSLNRQPGHLRIDVYSTDRQADNRQ